VTRPYLRIIVQGRIICVTLRRADARREYLDQGFGLFQERIEFGWLLDQWHAPGQPQPAPALSKLLETDAEFVDEIVARLRRLRFSVVWQRRGAAAK
jgi:hypothetical protein